MSGPVSVASIATASPTGGSVPVAAAGLSRLFGRMSDLDSLLRSFDPTWVGLDDRAGAGAALASSASSDGASGSAFDRELSSATGALATSGAPSVSLALRTASSTGGAIPADERMTSPLPGATLTQAYGPTSLSLEPPATVNGVTYPHFHNGIDLAAPLGTPVLAAADGTVVAAGRASDGAVIVRIRHDDGSETLYGHLEASLAVSVGDRVAAGQRIGNVGLTGNTTGPHLHFALSMDGSPVDPQHWLDAGVLPGVTAATAATTAAAPSSQASQVSQAAGTASVGALASFDAVASSIPYAAEIRSAAVAAGVDPLLLASLVKAESGFHPNAVSSAGAMGLTQLMPATATSLHVTNAFDPQQNLNAGARYLASDLRLFGRVDLALAAYQAGKGAVRQYGGVPPYPSTQAYIRNILASWSGYLHAAGATGVAGAAGVAGATGAAA